MNTTDQAFYDTMVADTQAARGSTLDMARAVSRLKAWYREWWRRANGLG